MLKRSPFLGAIFEGFVASEIIKGQVNSGRSKQLYYFRDQQGLEVDFLVPAGNRRLLLFEAKASRTVLPEMAEPLSRLSKAIDRYRVESFLIYQPSEETEALTALRPGIKALSLGKGLSVLVGHQGR
jgi:predicted AAA+ superfamily ATPase